VSLIDRAVSGVGICRVQSFLVSHNVVMEILRCLLCVHLENSIEISYEHRPAENCYW
jgi:hypothetical protein